MQKPIQRVGLFKVHHFINHSCVPNCINGNCSEDLAVHSAKFDD